MPQETQTHLGKQLSTTFRSQGLRQVSPHIFPVNNKVD